MRGRCGNCTIECLQILRRQLSVAHGTVNLQHVHFDVRRDRTYTLRARTMLLIQEYAPPYVAEDSLKFVGSHS